MAPFSVQAQLKRMADLLVAALLLLLTAPFVLLAALLMWLEDRGPVLYSQQRSGWLGRPFTLYKLRTMSVQPADAPVRWTEPGDQRITAVGVWLRRVRLDELPQLFNVLNGEMSLIGPRPERPELEDRARESHPPLPQTSLDATWIKRLGPGVCSLCKHYRGFRSQALLRPLLFAELQRLA